MNNRLLRVIVLLISITGAGAYVWFSSQQEKPPSNNPLPEKTAAGERNDPSTEEEAPAMFSSSKSIDHILDFKTTKDLIEPVPPIVLPLPEESTITDEEVRKRRDAMMSSSKIGRIISEEDVRKLMEEEAKEKSPQTGQQQE